MLSFDGTSGFCFNMTVKFPSRPPKEADAGSEEAV